MGRTLDFLSVAQPAIIRNASVSHERGRSAAKALKVTGALQTGVEGTLQEC